MSLSGTGAVEVQTGLRWDTQQVIDRDNAGVTAGWTTTRLHDSAAEAQDFLLTHLLAIAGTGTATFVAGEVTKSCTAAVTATGRAIGCTSIHTYALTGGKLT